MASELIYGLTAILVGLGLIAVSAMFLAAGILFWRQSTEMLRERREADDEIKKLDKRPHPSVV